MKNLRAAEQTAINFREDEEMCSIKPLGDL